MGHALDAELGHQGVGRQIFAERHKPVLVVDPDHHDVAGLAAQGDQAVVVDRFVGRPLVAIAADQQDLAGLERVDDRLPHPAAGDHVVVDRQRQGALGPDDDVGWLAGMGLGRQRDIGLNDLCEAPGVPLGFLRDVGLDDADGSRRVGLAIVR